MYNIVKGRVAPNEDNVNDVLLIGEKCVPELPFVWIPCQDSQSSEDYGAS